MPRLTRAESRAQTRERLLVTAKQAFLRDGYSGTSLDKIADEAGYSKGAVYSNFRNKDELFLAVLDGIHAEQVELVAEATRNAVTLEERLAAFQSWAERMIGDRSWTALEVEFAPQVRRNPQLAAQLVERHRAIRARIAALLAAQAEEFDIALPMPAEDLATALLSLGIGLGCQRAIDRSIPATVLTDVVRALAGRPRVVEP